MLNKIKAVTRVCRTAYRRGQGGAAAGPSELPGLRLSRSRPSKGQGEESRFAIRPPTPGERAASVLELLALAIVASLVFGAWSQAKAGWRVRIDGTDWIVAERVQVEGKSAVLSPGGWSEYFVDGKLEPGERAVLTVEGSGPRRIGTWSLETRAWSWLGPVDGSRVDLAVELPAVIQVQAVERQASVRAVEIIAR